MKKVIPSVDAMLEIGKALGALLQGGEVIELIGDVGAGKTTFTKGLALGLGVDQDVQSPTYTISRIYPARDNLELAHYDFYRLTNPGVLKIEIEQVVHDNGMVTVIEWGDIIEGVLPENRLRVTLTAPTETTREIEFVARGERLENLIKGLPE